MSKVSKDRSIIGEILYPHLKITDEEFPRLLATRRILNETDEYFGAFLPTTNLRLWLYQLNRIFRLRSCEIEIDGNFPKPCQLFFTRQCLAPCVREICGKAEYDDEVTALKLFLGDREAEFDDFVTQKINRFSEEFEFEKAARWRDLRIASTALSQNKKLAITLENAVDTYSLENYADKTVVFLVTTRGRKLAGTREFIFDKKNYSPERIFEEIIREFYQFHAPREIHLPVLLPQNKQLEKFLKEKFGKKVKISFHQNDLNITSQFRIKYTKMEYELEENALKLSPDEIKKAIQKAFRLPRKPDRIECFDVAHISNQDFVTASSVWENGAIRPESARHFILDVENELQAMEIGIRERLKLSALPDLIIVDGGKSQLNRALNELKAIKKNIFVIAAVKPPGKHKEIAYLLTPDERKITFQAGDRSFELIHELRDEAHRTANELYRQLHENRSIFSQDLPLVPVRFNEIGGAAEDLIPIQNILPAN